MDNDTSQTDGASTVGVRPRAIHVIAERDGWVCNGCGEALVPHTDDLPRGTKYATIDHIDPGGGNGDTNLWLMCNPCNSSKGKRPLEEWEKTLDFDGSLLRRGFTTIPNTVLDNANLSLGARMTLISLMSFAWRGDPFPGQARLAKMLGVSDRTVREYVGELIRTGYVKTYRRGRGKTNVYRLIQNKIISLAPEDSSGAPDQERKPASALDRKPASDKEYEVEEYKPTPPVVPPQGDVGAQALVAGYVDEVRALGSPAPSRVIGQVARGVKELLDEGIDPEVVGRALTLMTERRLHPATLASLVLEAAAGPRQTQALRYGRGMTTKQMLDATKGLK